MTCSFYVNHHGLCGPRGSASRLGCDCCTRVLESFVPKLTDFVDWMEAGYVYLFCTVLRFNKISSKGFIIELVSKELNHFGVIAGFFRQIGGLSSRFVLFCSF